MNTIDNDMLPEYDPSIFDNAVVGKYANRVADASNVIVLEPDLVKAFPNAESVNNALRQLLQLANMVRVATV